MRHSPDARYAGPIEEIPSESDHHPSGLIFEELEVGNGTLAEKGKTVTVHYTGWLTDGTKFDSSKDRNDRSNSRSACAM